MVLGMCDLLKHWDIFFVTNTLMCQTESAWCHTHTDYYIESFIIREKHTHTPAVLHHLVIVESQFAHVWEAAACRFVPLTGAPLLSVAQARWDQKIQTHTQKNIYMHTRSHTQSDTVIWETQPQSQINSFSWINTQSQQPQCRLWNTKKDKQNVLIDNNTIGKHSWWAQFDRQLSKYRTLKIFTEY